MHSVDAFPLSVATSLLNVGGVVLACEGWATLNSRHLFRLGWLFPALLLCAWLESSLSGSGGVSRRAAVDLALWCALAPVLVWARRRFERRTLSRGIVPTGLSPERADLKGVSDAFLSAVDRGDAAEVAAFYAPSFNCVRVADAGRSATLSRDQMLSVFGRETRVENPAANATHETTLWHVEAEGETGYVVMTRTKELGDGPERLFYTFVWSRSDGSWRLMREFVHQRSAPSWT